MTEADAALLVADDDERSKTETTAALHDFRDAVDVDETVHKFGIAFFAILTLTGFSCHVFSHLRGHAINAPLA
jgi:hypothetical protein